MDSVWLPLAYYQLWSVRLAGWLPALEHCSRCQRELGEHPAYADPGQGQLLCRSCRKGPGRLLRPESRQAAVEMLRNPLRKLQEKDWNRRRTAELSGYLLDTIEYHSERKLTTREIMDGKA